MFAVVEIGKKQYIVRKGDVLDVQKIGDSSKKVTFEKVLLLAGEDKIGIGAPYLEGAKVEAEITGQKRGKKIIVYKYKRRKKYRKKQGHRQSYTTVKITDIISESAVVKKAVEKKSVEKKATLKPASKKPVAKKTAAKKAASKKSPAKESSSK